MPAKFQISNNKFQTNLKQQYPNLKLLGGTFGGFVDGNLRFVWDLSFDIWLLDFLKVFKRSFPR